MGDLDAPSSLALADALARGSGGLALDVARGIRTAEGELVAEMDGITLMVTCGTQVQALIASFGETVAPGDMLLSNDPFAGGPRACGFRHRASRVRGRPDRHPRAQRGPLPELPIRRIAPQVTARFDRLWRVAHRGDDVGKAAVVSGDDGELGRTCTDGAFRRAVPAVRRAAMQGAAPAGQRPGPEPLPRARITSALASGSDPSVPSGRARRPCGRNGTARHTS